MGTPDVISIKEAANILGVQVREVRHLTKMGYLNSAQVPGKVLQYHMDEVVSYAEVHKERFTLAKTASVAKRAYAISRANEQKLKEVCHFLGLGAPSLETSEEAVKSLIIKAKDAVMDIPSKCADAQWVLDWARAMYAINDGYLRLVASYVDTEEPWKCFMILGRRMSDLAPLEMFGANKELEAAYGYLEAALRSLRHAAYFYVRDQYGVRASDHTFNMMEDYAEPILRVLFPN